jgi:hypothetical protein
MGLSFVCAAGPCQRSLSRVLVPWDLRSYFTVSDLRLPFLSPPTSRRVMVEVFDPTSTRVTVSLRPLLTLFSTYFCRNPCLKTSKKTIWSWSWSHITTDGQSVSKSWYITIWQLWSCFCGAPSLRRGRVCLLYMLLVLASTVFLGSESLGTRDRILLSDLRLPFSSPPTTPMVTVEVFDPASTREATDYSL